jgi:hypothetical protein
MFFGASLLHALTTAQRGIAGQLLDGVAAFKRRLNADKTSAASKTAGGLP